MYRKSIFVLLVVALLGALIAGCAAPAPAAPQIVKETVVVEKQVEKVVEKISTQVVEKQVQVEKVVTPTAAPRGPVKLTVWSHLLGEYPGLIPFWEEKTKEWQKTHPDVTIDFVSIPYDGSDAKYVSTFAGRKNAPDIWTGKVPYFAGGLGVADPAPKRRRCAVGPGSRRQHQGIPEVQGRVLRLPDRDRPRHDALLQHRHVQGRRSRSQQAAEDDGRTRWRTPRS